MSYPIDLDEYPEVKLREELQRRERLRAQGLCDYCEQPHYLPTCKFPGRHYLKAIMSDWNEEIIQ